MSARPLFRGESSSRRSRSPKGKSKADNGPAAHPHRVRFGSLDDAPAPTVAADLAVQQKSGGRPSAPAVLLNQRGRQGRRGRSRGRSRTRTPVGAAAVRVEASAPQRSWAAIAKSAQKGYSLTYTPPLIIDGEPVVHISDEVLEAANPKWKSCVVGYLVGRKLPFKLVESVVKDLWGTKLVEVMANEDGFFFFHIPDDEFRRQILDCGPITVSRVPLVLQQWHSRMVLTKDSHDTLPVWIRIKSIPLSFWSEPAIGLIASAIGRPLYVDMYTEAERRLSFARVCVEIKANQPRQNSVVVRLDDGDRRKVDVEYEWVPVSCAKCGVFGHKCKSSPAGSSPPDGAPAAGNNLNVSEVVSPVSNPPIVPTRPPTVSYRGDETVLHGLGHSADHSAIPELQVEGQASQVAVLESWTTVGKGRKHKTATTLQHSQQTHQNLNIVQENAETMLQPGQPSDVLPLAVDPNSDVVLNQCQTSSVVAEQPLLQGKRPQSSNEENPRRFTVVQSLEVPGSSPASSPRSSGSACSSEEAISNVGSEEDLPSPEPVPRKMATRGSSVPAHIPLNVSDTLDTLIASRGLAGQGEESKTRSNVPPPGRRGGNRRR